MSAMREEVYMDEGVALLEPRIARIESDLGSLNEKVDRIDQRVACIDKKVDDLDRKVDGLDKRVDGLDKKVDGLDKRVDDLDKKVAGRAAGAALPGEPEDLAGKCPRRDFDHDRAAVRQHHRLAHSDRGLDEADDQLVADVAAGRAASSAPAFRSAARGRFGNGMIAVDPAALRLVA